MFIRKNRVDFGNDKYMGYGNAPIIDTLTDDRQYIKMEAAAIQHRYSLSCVL